MARCPRQASVPQDRIIYNGPLNVVGSPLPCQRVFFYKPDTKASASASNLIAILMSLIEQIDDLLPQTQCRQCGYDGCLAYAQAIVNDGIPINRCAPGGQKGIDAIANALGCDAPTLDPEYGQEVELEVAHIVAEHCIGCRKCVAVCPTGAIVGAPKRLHGILTDWCTGCALCVTPCPVDCIEMIPAPFNWTQEKAHEARNHYRQKCSREEHRKQAQLHRLNTDTQAAQSKKQALIASIMSKIRQ